MRILQETVDLLSFTSGKVVYFIILVAAHGRWAIGAIRLLQYGRF